MRTVGAKRGFAPWADPNPRPLLRLEGVTKGFGGAAAVDQVSLDIFEGEFFALLGPSGCGKTTLMRLIAGFETPDTGRIMLDGGRHRAVPPHRRPVNMMFQSYALFPHLTVEGNIAFGLQAGALPRREIAARVADMLALVQARRFRPAASRTSFPAASASAWRWRGRWSSGRACCCSTSRWRRSTRSCASETQFELMELQRSSASPSSSSPTIRSEAMTVADRIAVMDRGRLMQVAPPAEIYEQPNSRWVADFVGDVNLFEGRSATTGV